MAQDQILRDHLTKLLQTGQAFTPLEEILADLTAEDAGKSVPELPYTLWQLTEHLRIALFDILDYSRTPHYKSPEWPAGYWPSTQAPSSQAALDNSIREIKQGLAAMVQMVQDPAHDLFKPFAANPNHNLFREAMLVAEHNAYHLGQILVVRRLLGHWD